MSGDEPAKAVTAAPPHDMWLAWRLVCLSFGLSTAVFALLALIGVSSPYPLFVSGGHSRFLELGAGCIGLTLVGVAWALWRRHGWNYSFVAVLLLALLWLNVVRQESPRTWDFDCYFWPGRVITTGVNIYDWQGQAEVLHHARLTYTPAFALLFSGSRFISDDDLALEVSFLLWTGLNYWATVLLACLLPTILSRIYGWPLQAAAVGTLLALAVNVPLQRTLFYSQVNVLIVDGFLVFILLSRRRPWLASLALCVPVLIKTTPLLLAGLFLPARRYQDLGRFVAVLVALIAVSMAVIGTQPWLDFLAMAPHARDDVVQIYRENSLFNVAEVICDLVGAHHGAVLHLGGGLLVALAWVGMALVGKRRGWRFPWTTSEAGLWSVENLFPFALIAIVLVSPKVWEHLWLWVLLPGVLVVYGVRADPRRLTWAVLGYALIFWVPTFDYLPFSFHRLAGCLCLLACVAMAPRQAE